MMRETNIYACGILMLIACNFASQSQQCVNIYLLGLLSFLCRYFCLVICSHSAFYISLLHFPVTVGLYLHLAVSVVHEIKDALGIYCFRYGNLCVALLFSKLLCLTVNQLFSLLLVLLTG